MFKNSLTKVAMSALLVSALGVGSSLAQTGAPTPGDAGMKSTPTSPSPATPLPDQTAPGATSGTGSAAMPMDHADTTLSTSAGTASPDATTVQDSATTDGKKHKKHKKQPS